MMTIDWRLVVCGINHKSAALEHREALQIGHDEIARAHAELGLLEDVHEATIISTCNRIEFYLVAKLPRHSFDIVSEFYKRFKELDITGQRDEFYVFRGKHAAEHLFKVAAGVDSMVIGENQIIHQVREAYTSACSIGVTGKIIHRLFHHAFRIGKQVRTQTEMGRGACSVSSAATDLLKANLDSSARPNIVFVGVNRMISLAASRWSKLHHGRLCFANRTLEKANHLAHRFHATGHSLDELPELLAQADIVISCTGASTPLIATPMLSETILARAGRGPLTIMDMAVPRDVEYQGPKSDALLIYDLENVKHFVREHQQAREAAIPEAEELIAQRLGEFAYWYDHARYELGHNGLGPAFAEICREEMSSALDHLPDEYRQEVAQAAERMVKRLAQVKSRTGNGTR